MPVNWNPSKVALVALLDLTVSALPVLLFPLDGLRASTAWDSAAGESETAAEAAGGGSLPYSEATKLVAAYAAANVLMGMAVAYARPHALCPCHTLSVGDILNESANGVIGGVLAALLAAGLGSLCLHLAAEAPEMAALGESADSPRLPFFLPALCLRDRVSVQLSAILLLVSHTFLPLTVATKSSLGSMWRVVVRLQPGGPLEATVLAGTCDRAPF